jgi:nitroimidazol reductase NimA-like FMN-containing flavoprotein (pyridoxamine 5'-phosphate oxidase superfamily)
MLGELSARQINAVLFNEVIGRIGCHSNGRTYIVPITYVFDGEAVYAHSADGLKIQMMRANPNVCFQVDQRENLANWRSVVAWGMYQELREKAALDALELLIARLSPLVISETAHLHDHLADAPEKALKNPPKHIMYRIHLTEKTGRFERR